MINSMDLIWFGDDKDSYRLPSSPYSCRINQDETRTIIEVEYQYLSEVLATAPRRRLSLTRHQVAPPRFE
jgi:hypothetical protein